MIAGALALLLTVAAAAAAMAQDAPCGAALDASSSLDKAIDYHRDKLICGAGAFLEVACDSDDDPRAIRDKARCELQAALASR